MPKSDLESPHLLERQQTSAPSRVSEADLLKSKFTAEMPVQLNYTQFFASEILFLVQEPETWATKFYLETLRELARVPSYEDFVSSPKPEDFDVLLKLFRKVFGRAINEELYPAQIAASKWLFNHLDYSANVYEFSDTFLAGVEKLHDRYLLHWNFSATLSDATKLSDLAKKLILEEKKESKSDLNVICNIAPQVPYDLARMINFDVSLVYSALRKHAVAGSNIVALPLYLVDLANKIGLMHRRYTPQVRLVGGTFTPEELMTVGALCDKGMVLSQAVQTVSKLS